MARRSAAGVVLTHLEFDLLWEDLGSGDPPYPLEVPSHGETEDERDALGGEVLRSLGAAGLTEGEELSPELEDLFGLLVHGDVSIDALVFRPTPWRVVAKGRGRRGVLAVLNDHEVALEPVGDLVTAIVKVIGDAPAGPGEAVALPRPAFSAAMDAYARGGYGGMERVLAGAGVTGRATRAIATLVDSPRRASGQLAVGGVGGRSRVLSWTDTGVGRYVMSTDRTGWVRVVPADTSRLAREVAGLVAEVAEAAEHG